MTDHEKLLALTSSWEKKPHIMLPCAGTHTTEIVAGWIKAQTGISDTLLDAARKVDEQISAIHAAFGAPGDHGYETREGKALYALYGIQPALRSAIAAAKTDVA